MTKQKLKRLFQKKHRPACYYRALLGCPQKKGVCLKVYITTPRKPNSAKRKTSRVLLTNSLIVNSYIPGITHNLQKHSAVLIRGGRTKDLPGMKYVNIRGHYDFQPLATRRNACSKYGTRTTNTRRLRFYTRRFLWK